MSQEKLVAVQVDAGLFAEGSRWAIYGAGGMGRQAARFLLGQGVQITCLLDQSAGQGLDWEGIPVLDPESQAAAEVLHGASILVAVFNYTAPLAPIYQLLARFNPRVVMPYPDFHEAFHHLLPDNYWLTRRSFYLEHTDQMEAARAALADEMSRATWQATLALRLRGEWQELEALRQEPQYFPAGIGIPHVLDLVDCGACVGETEENAAAAGHELQSVYAFEPDTLNFLELSRRLAAKDEVGQVALWPCGVWSGTTQLRFAAGTGASSHLDERGDTVVQVLALDEALPRTRVNFLKMDVEGAEPSVLEGARQLITRERPCLAVCVYHEPAHLWAILLQLREWLTGYKFYLRSHQYNGFDLVLYAIPDSA